MKTLLTLILMAFFLMGFTQEIKPKQKMMTYQTEKLAIGTSKPTTFYITLKGVKYPIYEGSKGGRYYIIKDNNNQYRRHYIPKTN